MEQRQILDISRQFLDKSLWRVSERLFGLVQPGLICVQGRFKVSSLEICISCLRICISCLRICIFSLKIYISSLKIKIGLRCPAFAFLCLLC